MNTHPFIQYWNRTHKEDAVAFTCGRSFHFPGFPDPLMSPVFLSEVSVRAVAGLPGKHFNVVGDFCSIASQAEALGFTCKKRFHIAISKPLPSGFTAYETLSMNAAIHEEWFWPLLTDGFPKDAAFLKPLLIALSTKDFHTIVIRKKGVPVAMMNIGLAAPQALIMTAAVRSDFRGNGLSHLLVKAGHDFLFSKGVDQALFWTEHSFLTPIGNDLADYMVFVKA